MHGGLHSTMPKRTDFRAPYAPIQSAFDITPEDIACQLTLIDLPLFKAIGRDELINCMGTCSRRGRKQDLSPNIVTMNRQFNQVTFWVVGQILQLGTARARARMISHFIKVARRLRELNNINSCHAVTSALFSSPIFRLEKTWHYVGKKHTKEKQHLDKLMFFFSDQSNFESLRRHLDTCQLPCIPYLGMYLRDLIYVSTANPVGTPKRNNKMASIIDAVQNFQKSEYTIESVDRIQAYLHSCRYLDELQKILEDENYRKSLNLEPPESAPKKL
ncbi:Ras-specific guanine nucleotide-releasing factor RalGPS1 [Fragariocoptes setiger]|uniref:Ras-specific guanine nucleotide-releasing factor RalGPS1 n=1 Tax=Fragariocoptes setiger TaxID=1670756 RepID=A0ABQ7S9R7_9ACAR|nr:Ras-specific guanine nucleotide-releasing factor RalGPS1 [Fragariocoptes setiger]